MSVIFTAPAQLKNLFQNVIAMNELSPLGESRFLSVFPYNIFPFIGRDSQERTAVNSKKQLMIK
jgi:hypothetical protein